MSQQHLFDVDIAVRFDVDQAILIKTFQFWIQKNLTEERNFHEQRVWTYNKYDKFPKHFPYWTPKQVRRILDKLIENGVLLKGKFAEEKSDRTNYYAFKEQAEWLDFKYVSEEVKDKLLPFAQTGKSICQNGQMDLTKRADGFDQTGRCIYNDTDNNTDNNQIKHFGSFLSYQPNFNGTIDYGKVNAIIVEENFREKYIVSSMFFESFLEKEMQLNYMGYRRNYGENLKLKLEAFLKNFNGSTYNGKKHLDNAIKKFLNEFKDVPRETVATGGIKVSIPSPFKK